MGPMISPEHVVCVQWEGECKGECKGEDKGECKSEGKGEYVRVYVMRGHSDPFLRRDGRRLMGPMI